MSRMFSYQVFWCVMGGADQCSTIYLPCSPQRYLRQMDLFTCLKLGSNGNRRTKKPLKQKLQRKLNDTELEDHLEFQKSLQYMRITRTKIPKHYQSWI